MRTVKMVPGRMVNAGDTTGPSRANPMHAMTGRMTANANALLRRIKIAVTSIAPPFSRMQLLTIVALVIHADESDPVLNRNFLLRLETSTLWRKRLPSDY